MPGVTPTLTQIEELAQLTPSSVVFAVGTVPEVHPVPPVVVASDAPWPTATQSFALEQSTAFISGTPDSSELDTQLDPSFVDVATTPKSVSSPPTATHVIDVGHEIALKPPSPRDAPPGVGTSGVSPSFVGAVQWAPTLEDVPDAVTGAGADVLERPAAAAIDPTATINNAAVTAVAKVLRVR